MPRGGRLTNVARGLCGSFASRNNDLDGYWTIGKLRSLAEQYGQTTVLIDVLMVSIYPSSSEFASLTGRYRSLLTKLAHLSGIRLEEITAAYITLDFAPPPWPRINFYKPQWGDQFNLTVALEADGRPAGIAHHIGYCRSHDPARESRAARPSAC